jgi:hypothetical protein
MGVGTVQQFVFTLQHPDEAWNTWAMLQALSMMPPHASVGLFVVRLAAALVGGVLALWGFRLLGASRRKARRKEAVQGT